MIFWHADTVKLEEFRPGIMSKAAIGDDLVMVCMQIGQELEDSGHVHTFDQCGIVIEGPIEMFVGEDRRLLNAHECYFIPAGERHGWKTFEKPVKLFDISAKEPIG